MIFSEEFISSRALVFPFHMHGQVKTNDIQAHRSYILKTIQVTDKQLSLHMITVRRALGYFELSNSLVYLSKPSKQVLTEKLKTQMVETARVINL